MRTKFLLLIQICLFLPLAAHSYRYADVTPESACIEGGGSWDNIYKTCNTPNIASTCSTKKNGPWEYHSSSNSCKCVHGFMIGSNNKKCWSSDSSRHLGESRACRAKANGPWVYDGPTKVCSCKNGTINSSSSRCMSDQDVGRKKACNDNGKKFLGSSCGSCLYEKNPETQKCFLSANLRDDYYHDVIAAESAVRATNETETTRLTETDENVCVQKLKGEWLSETNRCKCTHEGTTATLPTADIQRALSCESFITGAVRPKARPDDLATGGDSPVTGGDSPVTGGDTTVADGDGVGDPDDSTQGGAEGDGPAADDQVEAAAGAAAGDITQGPAEAELNEPGDFICSGQSMELPSAEEVLTGNTPFRPTFLNADFSGQGALGAGEESEIPDPRDRDIAYSGTTPFETCQIYTHLDWSKVAGSSPNYAEGGNFAYAWAALYEKTKTEMDTEIASFAEAFKAYKAGGESASVESLSEPFNKLKQSFLKVTRKANTLRRGLKVCAGAGTMMEGMDFDNADYTTPENTVQSMDGAIACTTKGAETQDYPPCKKGVAAVNVAMLANKGLEAYQQINFTDFSMEQQMELQKNAAQGAEADFTMALKSQRDAVLKHADQLKQMAVFDAVKMGVFFAFMKSMPTQKDMVNKCTGSVDCELKYLTYQYNEFNLLLFSHIVTKMKEAGATDLTLTTGEKLFVVNTVQATSMQAAEINAGENAESRGATSNTTPSSNFSFTNLRVSDVNGGADNLQRVCSDAATEDPGVAIIENGDARDALKQQLMDATVALATHLLQKNILEKQAARIQDAINGLQNFEPIPLTFTGNDLLATLCSEEGFPQHPDCLNLDGARTFGFPNQNFNINGASPGETLGGGLASTNNDNALALPNSSDPDARITSNSRPIPNVKADGNGGLTGLPGGSGGLKGSGGAGNGGGGGANAGSTGAPGGGGAQGGGGAKGPGRIPASKMAYGGDSRGTLNFASGRGNTKAKAKSKNPFANFKQKKDSGGVLSFRNPAAIGSKSSNIFNMISKRYGSVTKQNRLLKYEAVKK